MKKPWSLYTLLPLMLIAVGCAATKSEDVLSPTIAGPIPGIAISAPTPVEPVGTRISIEQQPVVLSVQNATSNGPRPLDYLFEVAMDANFSNKLLTRENIPPGDGRTSLRLDGSLDTGRTYYWRARAQDGANTGPYSHTAIFDVFTPIVIGRPVPHSPVNGETTSNNAPTFLIGNAPRTGPVTSISYVIEVADSDSFANKSAIWQFDEQGGSQTRLVSPEGFRYGAQYFWRVRAYESTVSMLGPWSDTQHYKTAAPPAAPPGGGGGGGGGRGGCGPPKPSTGDAVAACVSSLYPAQQAAGVSGSQRRANMQFLRDRMIEVGICGGMDLGWNRKGDGTISVDGLAWKINGVPFWVDTGIAYDDTSQPLQLAWLQGGQTGGFVAYSPRPTCQ